MFIKWENMAEKKVFHGQREYRVDAKGRVPFPPHWLPHMDMKYGEALVLAKGLSPDEHYLELFSPDEWTRQVDKIRRSLPEGKMKSSFIRWYLSSAESVELDGQNRIRLPKGLMEWAGVKRDVVLMGTMDTLQLWSKEELDKNEQFNPDDFDEIFSLFNAAASNSGEME